jgi:hypothetical protein
MPTNPTRLMLAMLLLPPITQPGRTSGRSGWMLCGLIEAIPGSEEEEKHFHDVMCYELLPFVCMTRLLVRSQLSFVLSKAITCCVKLLFGSS